MTCDCAACQQGGGRSGLELEAVRRYGAHGGIGSLAKDIAKLKVLRTETAIRRAAAGLGL
jgi:hypothetical protein